MSFHEDLIKFRDESLTNFFFRKECEVPSLIQKLILCSNFKRAFLSLLAVVAVFSAVSAQFSESGNLT